MHRKCPRRPLHLWGDSLIAAAMLCAGGELSAQSIEELVVIPDEDTVKITYNLVDAKRNTFYDVELLASTDRGVTFPITARCATGDIRYGIRPGASKSIVWEPLRQGTELYGDNVVFRLKGRFLAPGATPDFVAVSGGEFDLGDTFAEGAADERLVHPVSVDHFELGRHLVTNAQFAYFLVRYGGLTVKRGPFEGEAMVIMMDRGLRQINRNYWAPDSGYDYHPAVGVTWYGAVEYAKFVGGRLPTEAEWEYAAREGGKKVRFGNGRDIADAREINFHGQGGPSALYAVRVEGRGATSRVSEYPANALGLYDMSGNVWQWCQDWYHGLTYSEATTRSNPKGPPLGTYKVIRGGSWHTPAHGIRASKRNFLAPYEGRPDVGFRVAHSVHDPPDTTHRVR